MTKTRKPRPISDSCSLRLLFISDHCVIANAYNQFKLFERQLQLLLQLLQQEQQRYNNNTITHFFNSIISNGNMKYGNQMKYG